MPFIEQNASDNRSQATIEKLELNSAYLTDENAAIDKHVQSAIHHPFLDSHLSLSILGVNHG